MKIPMKAFEQDKVSSSEISTLEHLFKNNLVDAALRDIGLREDDLVERGVLNVTYNIMEALFVIQQTLSKSDDVMDKVVYNLTHAMYLGFQMALDFHPSPSLKAYSFLDEDGREMYDAIYDNAKKMITKASQSSFD